VHEVWGNLGMRAGEPVHEVWGNIGVRIGMTLLTYNDICSGAPLSILDPFRCTCIVRLRHVGNSSRKQNNHN